MVDLGLAVSWFVLEVIYVHMGVQVLRHWGGRQVLRLGRGC